MENGVSRNGRHRARTCDLYRVSQPAGTSKKPSIPEDFGDSSHSGRFCKLLQNGTGLCDGFR